MSGVAERSHVRRGRTISVLIHCECNENMDGARKVGVLCVAHLNNVGDQLMPDASGYNR